MANNADSKKLTNGKMKNKNIETNSKKSALLAYILWLTGGIFGAHHFYLERDNQAIVWLLSFGGYFGWGCFRDLFKIPTYVAEANNDYKYNEYFKQQIRIHGNPPFSTARFLGTVLVSSFWAYIFYIAIPENEIYDINFKYLYFLIPLVISLGTWLIGNIGREQGSIWFCLVVSYICYPTIYYFGDETTWICVTAVASALAFDTFSKEWRLKPQKKKSTSRKIFTVIFVLMLYCATWTSYLYFNATITDSEGEEIKFSEALKHFFTSPIWMDVKTSLEHMWTYAQHQGFWAVWKELIDLSDPRGEINAYTVLGLSQTASEKEVTSRWRALSREHHPDKVKGTEEERRAAQEKFMEIQEAYEILSNAKNRRQRRNRKPS